MDQKFRSGTVFLDPEKAVNWAEERVKKVIDSEEKELRVVLSNNLRENI